MQKIPVDRLNIGMVIGNDVLSPQGVLVVNAQSVVDEAMQRRLCNAGVTEVVVMGKDVPGYGMGYDPRYMCDQLPKLFRNCKEDPFMMSVCAILMKHFKARV